MYHDTFYFYFADMRMPKEDIYIGKSTVEYLRFFIVAATLCVAIYIDELQTLSNNTYSYLLSSIIFNSVYFETFWATICYAVIIPVYPWFVAKQRWLDKYKIDPSVTYVPTTVLKIIQDAIIYVSPLMLLDTFMVKMYCGVDSMVWVEKRQDFIQVTRALPTEPPPVGQMVYHLVASLIVYDIIFFALHYTLHRNYFLYNYVHKPHHDHGMIHAHVTNQLTVPERIALILSANFALKVFNSHPWTRTIFVPIFIFILVDNHSGYDMPFGLHRLVPFGLVGGSLNHFQHHMKGKRHYQPILTYLDKLLDCIRSMK